MIYLVLNLSMSIFMLGLAFYTDKVSKSEVTNPLIPMSVLLALSCACMGLTVFANIQSPERMPLMFARFYLLFSAAYSIDFCIYCILYPAYKRSPFVNTVKWGLYIVATWFVFTKIEDVNITNFLGVQFISEGLSLGNLTNYFPFTWYDLFMAIVLVALPSLSAIIMILRAENREDRLNMQKSVINVVGLVVAWIAIFMIKKASIRVPMFVTLYLFSIGLTQSILVFSEFQNFLYDLKYLIGVVISFTVCYLVPAGVVGFMFPRLWPIISNHPFLFFIYISVVVIISITVSYQISKFLSKKSYFRSFQYADSFEESLSKFDYSAEPEEIVHSMKTIFAHNLGLNTLKVLVENSGNLESIYDYENEESVSLNVSDKLFDTLMNQNKTIVLKSAVENSHRYESEKKEVLKLFADTKSEAIILLAEGRRIIGALLLGPKVGGNIYGDYDYDVFRKLYSYLFVFAYYMKNIANQSIVGTINREIRMSSQIIESIQENMDPIKNPKFDTGYIMEHAHNIGGEFVDLIKLNEDRHIFVLGDLSGKGISASMSMVIIKSIIRTYLAETKDFKLLVEKVNSFIRFNLPKGTFFEGIFGLIDFRDDNLYYINCGVPALFLYTRSYNNVIEIQGDGKVLGFVKDISKYLKVKKVKLNQGDIIVTCTDGLIDSKSLRGEVYGKERIQKTITENTSFPASKIANITYTTCLNFLSKGLDDDVSIFVLKRLANVKQ